MTHAPTTPLEWFVALSAGISIVDIAVRIGILCMLVWTLMRVSEFSRRLTALETGANACRFQPEPPRRFEDRTLPDRQAFAPSPSRKDAPDAGPVT